MLTLKGVYMYVIVCCMRDGLTGHRCEAAVSVYTPEPDRSSNIREASTWNLYVVSQSLGSRTKSDSSDILVYTSVELTGNEQACAKHIHMSRLTWYGQALLTTRQ